MKTTIHSRSFGTVAPYVVAGLVILPPVPYTSSSAVGALADVRVFVNASPRYEAPWSAEADSYSWDFTRPDLSPRSLVAVIEERRYEAYEPFIASEGWREVMAVKGPIPVREDTRQATYLDEYDQSAIGLYETEQ